MYKSVLCKSVNLNKLQTLRFTTAKPYFEAMVPKGHEFIKDTIGIEKDFLNYFDCDIKNFKNYENISRKNTKNLVNYFETQNASLATQNSLNKFKADKENLEEDIGKRLDAKKLGKSELIKTCKINEKTKITKAYVERRHGKSFSHKLKNVIRNNKLNPKYKPDFNESLCHYEAIVTELTGLEIANVTSVHQELLAIEALHICHDENQRRKFLISNKLEPEIISKIEDCFKTQDFTVEIVDVFNADFSKSDIAGIIFQYPDVEGNIEDFSAITHKAHLYGTLVCCATNLLGLTLIKAPADFGCDIAFGTPKRNSEKTTGFFACTKSLLRRLSKRTLFDNSSGFQMNVDDCIKDVANFDWKTLRDVARKIHNNTLLLHYGLKNDGNEMANKHFFDTLCISPKLPVKEVRIRAQEKKIKLVDFSNSFVAVSLEENATAEDINDLFYVFGSFNTFENLVECKEIHNLSICKSKLGRMAPSNI